MELNDRQYSYTAKKNSLSVEMILQYTKTTDLLKVNIKSMLSYTLCFIVIV